MAPHLDGVGRVVAAVEVLDGDVGAVLGALAIRLALALKLVLCERPLVTPRKPPLLPPPTQRAGPGGAQRDWRAGTPAGAKGGGHSASPKRGVHWGSRQKVRQQ